MEEFSDSDSMSLNHIHDLGHQSINGLGSSEIDINWLVSGLGTSVSLIDFILKACAVIQEWKVLDISELSSIDLNDGGQLSIRNLNSEKSDSLLELLWRDLEMVVSILVLEETLGIKSLSVDKEHELLLNLTNVLGINIIWLLNTVERLGSSVIKRNVDGSLKIFLGENLINLITEFSPLNMVSSLWSLELFGQEFKLSSRKDNLAHVQSNSELGLSDEA